MNILITGAYGSGARYLAEYLVDNTNCNVHGLVRWDTKQDSVI